MSEPASPQSPADRSALDIGVVMTLAALGFAALIGVIGVVDAGGAGPAVAVGAGTTFIVFVAGGTIACALACLVRRRNEILALGGLAASGLAIDLFVLAIWREIDDDTYAKIAAIAFVWTFFGLLMLGLTLAVHPRGPLARALYIGTMVAAAVAGLISSWLLATSGDGVADGYGGSVSSGIVPYVALGDDGLLRPLAAALVLLSTLWFGALAASRLDQR